LKLRHIIWIVTAVVAIVSMAAGVAVLVNRHLSNNGEQYNYIKCECDSDED